MHKMKKFVEGVQNLREACFALSERVLYAYARPGVPVIIPVVYRNLKTADRQTTRVHGYQYVTAKSLLTVEQDLAGAGNPPAPFVVNDSDPVSATAVVSFYTGDGPLMLVRPSDRAGKLAEARVFAVMPRRRRGGNKTALTGVSVRVSRAGYDIHITPETMASDTLKLFIGAADIYPLLGTALDLFPLSLFG